jgi:GNAT superfamily N-acetyltransferase
MTFEIRTAGPGEADTIARISVEGWRWGYRGLLPDDMLAGLDEQERAERVRAVMADDGVAVATYVAQADDGEVIGFVSCGPDRDPDANPTLALRTGEVYAIYVVERVAGAGVGSALLRAAVDDLRARGFARARLWVLDANARARRFYEREGWTADGAAKTDEYRGATLSEVRYRREL